MKTLYHFTVTRLKLLFLTYVKCDVYDTYFVLLKILNNQAALPLLEYKIDKRIIVYNCPDHKLKTLLLTPSTDLSPGFILLRDQTPTKRTTAEEGKRLMNIMHLFY